MVACDTQTLAGLANFNNSGQMHDHSSEKARKFEAIDLSQCTSILPILIKQYYEIC